MIKSALKRRSRWSFIRDGVPALLTFPILWLLQAGLHLKVDALSSAEGWQSLVVWIFILWLVFGFWRRWMLRLMPPTPPPSAAAPDKIDPYAVAQAELATERTVSKT